jgi:hypothetical protein
VSAEGGGSWEELIRTSYQLAVGVWGIPPGDFWEMDLEEWFWIYDAKTPRDAKKETDYAELYELIQ